MFQKNVTLCRLVINIKMDIGLIGGLFTDKG